jgi:hypothetical protein
MMILLEDQDLVLPKLWELPGQAHGSHARNFATD